MKTKDQTTKSVIDAQEQREFCKLDRASREALLFMAIFLMAIKNFLNARLRGLITTNLATWN